MKLTKTANSLTEMSSARLFAFIAQNNSKLTATAGEEPPVCIGCDELLTTEHILLTCSDLIEIRESHFTAQSLRVFFQDIPPEKIFLTF